LMINEYVGLQKTYTILNGKDKNCNYSVFASKMQVMIERASGRWRMFLRPPDRRVKHELHDTFF
jgi:hypothetical protein